MFYLLISKVNIVYKYLCHFDNVYVQQGKNKGRTRGKLHLFVQKTLQSRSRYWNTKNGHDTHGIRSSTTLLPAVKSKLRFVFSCPVSSACTPTSSKRFLVHCTAANGSFQSHSSFQPN